MQINVGESITWDNPSTVGEPHIVTFVLDNTTMTNIVSPFSVPNSTQFIAIPPNSNNGRLRPPGENNVVIAVNSMSFVPTITDSQGDVKEYAPPNPYYTMAGTEGTRATISWFVCRSIYHFLSIQWLEWNISFYVTNCI
jgi:hypothetical protein